MPTLSFRLRRHLRKVCADWDRLGSGIRFCTFLVVCYLSTELDPSSPSDSRRSHLSDACRLQPVPSERTGSSTEDRFLAPSSHRFSSHNRLHFPQSARTESVMNGALDPRRTDRGGYEENHTPLSSSSASPALGDNPYREWDDELSGLSIASFRPLLALRRIVRLKAHATMRRLPAPLDRSERSLNRRRQRHRPR